MVKNERALNAELRATYMEFLADMLRARDEDVVVVGSNKLAIPVVDSESNEKWIEFTVAVPTGSRAKDEVYDGYEMARSYEMDLKSKAAKASAKSKNKS